MTACCAGQPVRGRTNQHHPLRAQRNHLQVGRGGGIGDDPQVDFAVQDRVIDLVGPQVFQPHLGLGITPHEVLHAAAHVVQPDGVDRGHAHQPGDLHAKRADAGLDRIVEFQDLAKALETGLALGREHEGPLGAIDQLHAEMLLDAMDRLGGRRLADFVEDRPAGEALVLDDIAEDADGLDVHRTEGPGIAAVADDVIRASYHKTRLLSTTAGEAAVKSGRSASVGRDRVAKSP